MVSYRVRRGDTLGRIARRFYGDAARFPVIVAANRIPDPDKLAVGRKLVIPDLSVVDGTAAGVPPAPRMPPLGLSFQRLDRLHPAVRTRGAALLELCMHEGLSILVSQGLRTWEEQDALYARGRTTRPIGRSHVVTRAKGGRSFHNFGLAFDIVVLDGEQGGMGRRPPRLAHGRRPRQVGRPGLGRRLDRIQGSAALSIHRRIVAGPVPGALSVGTRRALATSGVR